MVYRESYLDWLLVSFASLQLIPKNIKCLYLSKLSHVSIKDLPLGNFSSNGITRRGLCRNTSFSDDLNNFKNASYQISSLGLACIVVEFISHGLLDCFDVFWGSWVLSLLVSDGLADLCLLVLDYFFLSSCLS